MALKKLLIANWKMNPESLSEAKRLFAAEMKSPRRNNVETVICPPFVYLSMLAERRPDSTPHCLGAQDAFWEESGPYTGEVSPTMLKKLGVAYVILGHSERRRLGESNEMVGKKVKAARKAHLKVVLCVGETKTIRRRGVAASKRFVRRQLADALRGLVGDVRQRRSLIVAYEPVWAISTEREARADSQRDVAEMVNYLRDILRTTFHMPQVPVLYGGSVNGNTIKAFERNGGCDGYLVGGASLHPKEFAKMVRIVDTYGAPGH